MHYSAIFFDLDGTLLPMDLDVFTKNYFQLLAARILPEDSKTLIAAVWQGTKAMIANDGTMTNEQRFWSVFTTLMGADIRSREPEFADFYETDFHRIRTICGENPRAKELIAKARQHADQVVLATNPLYPLCGVRSRLSWIGLTPEDFDYVTTYENSSFCKPSTAYYRQICDRLGLDPCRCLMIGNDLQEDAWAAGQLGMDTHILTDCLIDHGLELNNWKYSTFSEFLERF